MQKGVVISMERFNKILDIDELNLQATVEPGVITEVLQMKVRRKDCFIPPILQAADHVLSVATLLKIAADRKLLNTEW